MAQRLANIQAHAAAALSDSSAPSSFASTVPAMRQLVDARRWCGSGRIRRSPFPTNDRTVAVAPQDVVVAVGVEVGGAADLPTRQMRCCG